jgi:hypothetical protein
MLSIGVTFGQSRRRPSGFHDLAGFFSFVFLPPRQNSIPKHMMTVPEILKTLSADEPMPLEETLEAAVAQREAITPELLRVLDEVASDPEGYEKRENGNLALCAIFLLAQFREKRAYPLIVRIVSAPEASPCLLPKDLTSSGLDSILASVFDGDLRPLRDLIQNESADEFARWSAITSILILEHVGSISRESAVDFYRGLLNGGLQRTGSYVWFGLAEAIGRLPAPELLQEVRQAYSENLIDPVEFPLEKIESAAAEPKSEKNTSQLTLVDDGIEEICWWFAGEEDGESFADEEAEDWLDSEDPELDPEVVEEIFPQVLLQEPESKPQPLVLEPKIGRNEPCPCGSGKKYKKCCGK